MANYYIIQFDDGLALVPGNWVSKSKTLCFYPKYNSKNMNKAMKNRESPDIKNKEAGWAMYDVIRIFGDADTFERGREKLEAAESVSDINTDNEENLKQSRHNRAMKSNSSDEEGDVSGNDASSDSRFSPFPNPEKLCGSQSVSNQQKKPKILASYEEPSISENDEMSVVKKKIVPKIIKQEIFPPTKYANKKDDIRIENKENEDNSRLSPFPNPEKFCGSQSLSNQQKKPKILASYEEPCISENDEMSLVKKKIIPKIIKQETFRPTKHANMKDDVRIENEDFEDRLDKLFTIMSEVLKKVNRLSLEVAYINRRLVDYFENNLQPAQPAQIAITLETCATADDFQSFDQSLLDKDVFENMKQQLQLKGGTSLHDIIKNILKSLVRDEVLTLYSWKGAREKKEFLNMKVVDLIIAVVRFHIKNATEDEIKKDIINWLVQAPARVRRQTEKKTRHKTAPKKNQTTSTGKDIAEDDDNRK